jgi:exodeoxyribonuclease VII large subunit
MGNDTEPLITFEDLFDRAKAGRPGRIRVRGEVQGRTERLSGARARFELVDGDGDLSPTGTKSIPVLCGASSLMTIRDGDVVEVIWYWHIDDKLTWCVTASAVTKGGARGRLPFPTQLAAVRAHPDLSPVAARKLELKTRLTKRLPVTLPPDRRLRVTWIGPYSAHARKDIQGQLPERSVESEWVAVSFWNPVAIAEAIATAAAAPTDRDLIVIYRGGGSWRDWVALNKVSLVNAVAESRVPIVTAIGHEKQDVAIGWVSDGNFGTPTEVRKAMHSLVREQHNKDEADREAEQASAMLAGLRSTREELSEARGALGAARAESRGAVQMQVSLARSLALYRIRVRGWMQGAAAAVATVICVFVVPWMLPHHHWFVPWGAAVAILAAGTATTTFLCRAEQRARRPPTRPRPASPEVGSAPWFAQMEATRCPRHYRGLQTDAAGS